MGPTEVQGYYLPYPTRESRLPQAIFPREILASHAYLREVEAGLGNLAKKPVLLIWGERDPGCRKAERLRFLDHFNHAEIVLLPNAKHFVHVDEPSRTSDAILAFEGS
jgi:haloalkane dehalogenase